MYQMILWILVLAGVLWAVVHFSGQNRSGSSMSRNESALDILKKRYARGEISEEEFREKKRHLEE